LLNLRETCDAGPRWSASLAKPSRERVEVSWKIRPEIPLREFWIGTTLIDFEKFHER
jgi:hypothetical protein